MNTAPFADNPDITTAIDQIANYATNHLRRLPAIRLLKFELWLPEGIQDEENCQFLGFAESFRYFLSNHRLRPFCLWLRIRSSGRLIYLCAWFLDDFSSDLVEGYFKVAECIWKKHLGLRKDDGVIRWFHENDQSVSQGNGAKIKEGWSDDQQVNHVYNLWLTEMRLRANRIPDSRQALLTFGAVHSY